MRYHVQYRVRVYPDTEWRNHVCDDGEKNEGLTKAAADFKWWALQQGKDIYFKELEFRIVYLLQETPS